MILAEPLHEFHTLTAEGSAAAAAPYNDPLYDLQTNLRAMGIPAAQRRTQGEGVRIALIDTGVDSEHPDLRGQILSTRSFLTPAHRDARLLHHGTAMAGIIAAVANNPPVLTLEPEGSNLRATQHYNKFLGTCQVPSANVARRTDQGHTGP